MLGLYIHIPFCEKICHYCDFVKKVPRNKEVVDKYLKRLIVEINSYQAYFDKIDTIYIGGGTPNYLDEEQLTLLFEALMPINPVEFSIEINPDLMTFNKAEIFKKYKINRVSIGVQTFDEKTLKTLNRTHNKNDVVKAVSQLKAVGIDNISLDLIFGIPQTNLRLVKKDLKKALKLDVKHISYYALILEENTYFHYQALRGNFLEIDDDLSSKMYNCIRKTLQRKGYTHYEISNYAKPGYESKHNLIYWTMAEYIGVGLNASGFLNGYRYQNQRIFSKYYQDFIYEKYEVKLKDQLSEAMIMGLRKIAGIKISEIESKYMVKLFAEFPKIKEKIDLKLLEVENGYLKLTKKGIYLSNQVFQIFI